MGWRGLFGDASDQKLPVDRRSRPVRGGDLPAGMVPSGTLSNYTPTMRERGADMLRGLFSDDREGQRRAERLSDVLEAVTPYGFATGGYDAGRDMGGGNYLGGGLGLAMMLVPGPGKELKKIGNRTGELGREGVKNMASRSLWMYDPPVRPQRAFTQDYPDVTDAKQHAGRLASSIDGDPLTARFVAGRTLVGGGDEAIPPAQFDAIAEGLTGSVPQKVPGGSESLGGDLGRYIVTRDRRSGHVTGRDISFDRSLSKAKAERVVAHEIGHAIDEIAGEIPVAGFDDDLRRIYNDLNNPQRHGKKFGPEQLNYKKQKIPRELAAESIRAYIHDPNYIKTVAPDLAKHIRKAVNRHPQLSKTIQFNSIAAPIGMGLFAPMQDGADPTP